MFECIFKKVLWKGKLDHFEMINELTQKNFTIICQEAILNNTLIFLKCPKSKWHICHIFRLIDDYWSFADLKIFQILTF